MKIPPALVAAATLLAAALTAQAGPRVGIWINAGGGGCGPRYVAPPVCYAPAPVVYYRPRVITYVPAPVYCAPAPVVYAPRVYRAPIVTRTVAVGGGFGWRR